MKELSDFRSVFSPRDSIIPPKNEPSPDRYRAVRYRAVRNKTGRNKADLNGPIMRNNFSTSMLKAILSRALSPGALVVIFTNLVFTSQIWSQARTNSADAGLIPPVPQPVPEDFTWWYMSTFLLVITLGIVIAFWRRAKSSAATLSQAKDAAARKRDSWDSDALDGDKEMEWLRKHNNIINKKRPKKSAANGANAANREKAARQEAADKPAPVLTKEIQLAGVSDLPFNSILRLEYPHTSDCLPVVDNEESLTEAIEQVLDEYNEDEEMKELSMRILAAYKTRNSVDALSQVALYDLSSNSRCKAMEMLGEFNHPSVFETTILACADPTREVRAAAAKVLTRLGFNRADAWARAALLEDDGRKKQIARAAIEGGLVDRYFDRLTHSDYKQAYEAFALFTLLLKARETEPIAAALENHPSPMIRIAIVHVIKVNKEIQALPFLIKLANRRDLPKEVWEAVEAAIAKFSPEPEEA